MPQKSRQRRHSRAVPRGRVALLCALLLACAACPAVVDLDRDPEIEIEPERDAQTDTLAEPSVADAASTRGNVSSPQQGAPGPKRDADAEPCLELTAPPGVVHDAGAPPVADLGAGRPTSEVGTTGGTHLALRAVLAAGYLLPCGAASAHVLQVPDGYELSAFGQTGLCAPFETMFYRLLVSKSGQITVLDGVTVNPAQLRCDGGTPSFSEEPMAPPLA